MESSELRADMMHEARMCAEYAALGLWDEASRRARSYKRLESQLRAREPELSSWAPGEPQESSQRAGRPPAGLDGV